MSDKLLFEIFCEELPARFIPSMQTHTALTLQKYLQEQNISHGAIKVMATPRRIAVFIEDLAKRQEDRKEEIKGPSIKAAYDAQGAPSKALQGFLRSKQLKQEDLLERTVGKETYLFAIRTQIGQDTAWLLPKIFEKLLHSYNFPKSMRWGGRELRFVRPIRHLLCLWGDQPIDLAIENIPSGRLTFGHRLQKEPLEIQSADSYQEQLRACQVMIDPAERAQRIESQFKALEEALSIGIERDPDLFQEVLYLVEHPTVFYGKFDASYLSLPDEVISTPMKEQQRYFPVRDRQGVLCNYFVSVRNGSGDCIEMVREGNEKVLAARLSDALFFWEEDTSQCLEDFGDKLRDMVFHAKLGTMADKTERLVSLAPFFAQRFSVSTKDYEQAARLCKADLGTHMVFEFPELQGVMGGYYAQKQGLDPTISQAISEQYMPKNPGDALPGSALGRALAAADKADSLVGFFSAGLRPSGSSDAFGLRRLALGLLALWSSDGSLGSIEPLLESCAQRFSFTGQEPAAVKSEVLEFLRQRWKNHLTDQMAIRYDVVESVLFQEPFAPAQILEKAQALFTWVNSRELEDTLQAFKRVSNLAEKGQGASLSAELFCLPQEIALYKAFEQRRVPMEKAKQSSRWIEALEQITAIKPQIDDFFDHVMVMDNDPQIQRNRLALLERIAQAMREVADLSKIVYEPKH